ncbi:6-phospho-3-hexuloisomerase [Methanosarcinales archaeon]|nr:MAG: 6-phospho-3-hexuloisomerase [Methanosarcinales archaeon]
MANEAEKGVVDSGLRDGEYVSLLMELMGEHIKKVGRDINKDSVNKLIEDILNANAIFLMGAGRSGLVARAFAMRLMHLGLKVYVVGETTTPAVKRGDLVIAISGSGETRSIVSLARIAKEEIGAKLATITSNPESSLAKLSDTVILVEGKKADEISDVDYLERRMMGIHTKLTPLGTIFEITSLILLDSVVAELIARTGASEEELKARHSTLE